MTNTKDAFNIMSLICVSVSMATVIQVLQIIMLILSIVLTLSGVLARLYQKIKTKQLTADDIEQAKQDLENLADKVDKLKGDKNE